MKTQPYRILVASDGQPSSAGAIRVAAALARRRSAAVHALTVSEPFPHAIHSPFAIAPPAFVDNDNRLTALHSLQRQLAGIRGTRGWTMRATTGFAADSIVDAARRWPASLIIMGTGQHGLLGRLLGSETAVRVVSASRIPVLAVPESAGGLPARAVAAVDFSDASIAAASLAASLLGPNGTLTLLYASPLIVADSPSGSFTDLYTTGARERLAEIASALRGRLKRVVQFEVTSQGIVDGLLAHVQTQRSTLIALGAHEPTFLEKVIVGRVRAEVLRAGPCAVLVVPPAVAG